MKNNSIPLGGPALDKVTAQFTHETDFNQHPFSLPIIKNLTTINFPTQVTFVVGENGSGKSTILEAIAMHVGFGAEGGSRNINFSTSEERHVAGARNFADQLTLSWRMKPRDGYFFRAESFFNVANYLDCLGGAALAPYGGKSLHMQSHGESFLAFFSNRVGKGGFFIFDEPEAALSPQRQLSLLAIMHEICKHQRSQFIIATHSPILLAYPDATIYSCDGDELKTVAYKETEHYLITKQFLDNPDSYLRHLFQE